MLYFFLVRYVRRTNNNNNILIGVVVFILFYIIILRLLLEEVYKLREDFFIKKQGPFRLLCMRVYWDLLPRMVYFINNKSKKKRVLRVFKKRGGRVVLLKETGVIPKPTLFFGRTSFLIIGKIKNKYELLRSI